MDIFKSKDRIGRVFAVGMALTAAGPAMAQNIQRSCDFERVLSREGEMLRSDQTAIVARNGRNARVVVDGSGDYSGRADVSANGAVEIVFRTPVSKETMTIGPTGTTLWQINFEDGGVMAYFGSCGAERVTG